MTTSTNPMPQKLCALPRGRNAEVMTLFEDEG